MKYLWLLILLALVGCQAKYTSHSLMVFARPPSMLSDTGDPLPLVVYKEEQIVPLQERALASSHLLSMIEGIGISESIADKMKFVEKIRQNTTVEPAIVKGQVIGLTVSYADLSPRQAQQLCNGLTSLLFEEARGQRIKELQNTLKFLQEQADDARRSLRATEAQITEQSKGLSHATPEKVGDFENLAERHSDERNNVDALLENIAKVEEESRVGGEPLRVFYPASLPGDTTP